MLPSAAIPGIDYRHRRNLGRAPGPTFFVVPNDNHIGISANDADGILDLLALNFRRKCSRMLGRKHTPAQPVHGSFKRKPRPRRWFIEQCRENATLIIERPTSRNDPFHLPRAIE